MLPCLFLIGIIDAVLLGAKWLPLHGLADEMSHSLTAFIWLTAARQLGVRLPMIPGVVAAVAIDLDHVPDILGMFSPPEGTSRPVTHSLGLVAIIGLLACFDIRRRRAWTAIGIGLLSHLVRDLGTGAVLFWWPLSADPKSTPYMVYLSITSLFAIVALAGRALHPVAEHPPPGQGSNSGNWLSSRSSKILGSSDD
jgi:membrane-bound metal-dependent hydrolase YbcI (DUF457 family)